MLRHSSSCVMSELKLNQLLISPARMETKTCLFEMGSLCAGVWETVRRGSVADLRVRQLHVRETNRERKREIDGPQNRGRMKLNEL